LTARALVNASGRRLDATRLGCGTRTLQLKEVPSQRLVRMLRMGRRCLLCLFVKCCLFVFIVCRYFLSIRFFALLCFVLLGFAWLGLALLCFAFDFHPFHSSFCFSLFAL
jgi:hypothetical protein